jgi:GR25 family glycosyltransferase involved in LPS biosynthesis
MKLLEKCLFINLDERRDRLQHVKNELLKIGCENAERFPAIKMKHGAIGCTISHIKCLELAKERKYPQVFICEDDIVFTEPEMLSDTMKRFEKSFLMNTYNVLIIGGNNCPPHYKVTNFCIKITNCQCALGYIVKNRYYDTLINNMKDGLQRLLREPLNKPAYAVDMYWKRLQDKDDWLMLIPATVTQLKNYSNIEETHVNYDHLMLDYEKKEYVNYLRNRYNNNSLFSGDASIKTMDMNEISLEQKSEEKLEHKKKFLNVLKTIHIIPLFYSIHNFFDYINTTSEQDILILIETCKEAWVCSENDFSQYSFSK